MSFKRDGDDYAWLNTLQQRRISELFAVNIPEDEAHLMKNGRFACMVCHHRPVFDTVASLAVHRNGRRHAANIEEFVFKKSDMCELRMKRSSEGLVKHDNSSGRQVVNSLLGAFYDARSKRRRTHSSSASRDDVTSSPSESWLSSAYDLTQTAVTLPQTIDDFRRIGRRQSQQLVMSIRRPYCSTAGQSASSCAAAVTTYDDALSRQLATTSNERSLAMTLSSVPVQRTPTSLPPTVDVVRHSDRAQQYLRAVESGWKRTRDGIWVKDDAAEFDSDEEPPNV